MPMNRERTGNRLPRRLGWKGLSDAQLKDEAQLSGPEVRLARKPKRRR
jgi:hypothetical protein